LKPRSVLLISYYFPPLGMAGVQRPLKLAKYLFRLGWKVYVLTVKPVSYWETDDTLLKDFPKEIPIFRAGSLDPARLKYLLGQKKRVESGARSHPRFLWDSKIGFVPFAYLKASRLIEKFDIPMVWTTSPAPSIHLVGQLLKKRKGVHWVADFRDPWEVEAPEARSSFGQKREAKLKGWLSSADGATVVNDSLNKYFYSLASSTKIETVFNGFEPKNQTRQLPANSKIFTLAYCGTLNPVTNPYLFLKALARWKEETKNSFRLLLIGKTLGLPLSEWLTGLGLVDNTEIVGYLYHEQAIKRLSEADLFLLFLTLEEKYKLTLPAKIFEYIGLGRPILSVSSPHGAVADFLASFSVGCLCDTEEAIVKSLQLYHQLWEAQGYLRIPETERARFGWDKEAQKLSAFLETKLKKV